MMDHSKVLTVKVLRRLSQCALFFIFGLLLGVTVNYYGLIFESIHVSVDIRTVREQHDVPIYTEQLKEQNHSAKLSSSQKYVVPNTIHYIWFTNGQEVEMKFLQYLCIFSAYKVQRPERIIIHGDSLPVGYWWRKLWLDVPLQIIYRRPPKTIHGQPLAHLYHQGDIAKYEILLEYGGIYLDYDVLVINPLDPLRVYDLTLGKELRPELNAGVIISKPNAPFLRLIHESYKNNYRPRDWDYNCARVVYKIYEQRPDLVHVELEKLTRPDPTQRHLEFKEIIEWRQLYVLHVYQHDQPQTKTYNPEVIKTVPGTIGEVMRYIYYDSPQMIS